MEKIETKKYRSIEEYNFDKGFNLTKDDLRKIYHKTNELIDKEIAFIINIDGTLIFDIDGSSFYASVDGDFEYEDGVYVVSMDRYGGYKEDYKHTIYNDTELGSGVTELAKDITLSKNIINELNYYQQQQENKNGEDTYMSNYHQFKDEDVISLTKDELIEKIKEDYKDELEKKFEALRNEKKKRLEKTKAETILSNGLSGDEDFDYENDGEKWSFDMKKNVVIYSENGIDKFKITFKNKSDMVDKFSNNYKLRNTYSFGRAKNYLDDVSFKFENIVDELGNTKYKLVADIDYENNKINGVSVSKNKIPFLLNKIQSYDNHNEEITTERINLLNKLSGIKVDVLDMKEIKIDGLEFQISFSLFDREQFKVDFMGESKIVQWSVLKEHLTSGNSLKYLSKTYFIRFCRDIGIEDSVIENNISKVKVLQALDSEEKNE